MPRQKPFTTAFTPALGPAQNCECVIATGLDNAYESGDIAHAYTESEALRRGSHILCGVRHNGVTVNTPFAHTSMPWIEQHALYRLKFTQITTHVAHRENIDPTDPNFGTIDVIREPLYEIQITGYGPNQHRGLSRQAALQAFVDQHGLGAVYEVKRPSKTEPLAIYQVGTSTLAPGYSCLVLSDKNANVAQFFTRRLRHEAHRVFLDDQGRQTYFCGGEDLHPDTIHTAWDGIEGATAEVRDNYRYMKHSPIMWQRFLILPVHNLELSTAKTLEEPLRDETDPDPANHFNVKKRKHLIPFQDLTRDLPASVRIDAVTPGKRVDLRQGGTSANKVHVWSTRQTKTLP